ncbi:MAG TPA: 50S ribosomal protein L6 [Clostridia bacterium]|jgi:large subunit ribosomal protein L6|nr:50S ribosomal protein L6 [Clostridia bacterium]
MSRIGVKPINLGNNVTFKYEKNVVTVSGPKGTLTQRISNKSKIKIINENGVVRLENTETSKEQNAMHGLYRSLIANMVKGVTDGFEKRLIVNGVGYKVEMKGKTLVLYIGYSKPVQFETPEGITISVASPTEIVVQGCDKERVGQCAADIKSKRMPEPYHGYGIRYKDETILRKEIKAAGK